jgi:3-dehydroquinate synthase
MINSKITSKIFYTDTPEKELEQWIKNYGSGKIFIATEENVNRLHLTRFKRLIDFYNIKKVVVPSGEDHKKIESVKMIWEFLSKSGADRKSLLVNLGGGMLTDLAGFSASVFKRGIDFLNIPTTLLAQVDASVGGKTGINFNGLKNEVGTFKNPVAVIIHTGFLKTITHENFLSGFAEMIKHGLIKSSNHLNELQNFDLTDIDFQSLQEIIRHSVEVKEYFVRHDPTEQDIRKALNFGHTAGHAFESLAMEQNRPVMHGYAVAWGMITELFLSVRKCNFDEKKCAGISEWLARIYGEFEIEKDDFQRLFELMTHDKKNEAGRINFSLLPKTGKIEINQDCEKELIFEALEYFRTIHPK